MSTPIADTTEVTDEHEAAADQASATGTAILWTDENGIGHNHTAGTDCGGGCPKTEPGKTPAPDSLPPVGWTDGYGRIHDHPVHTDCGGGCPK